MTVFQEESVVVCLPLCSSISCYWAPVSSIVSPLVEKSLVASTPFLLRRGFRSLYVLCLPVFVSSPLFGLRLGLGLLHVQFRVLASSLDEIIHRKLNECARSNREYSRSAWGFVIGKWAPQLTTELCTWVVKPNCDDFFLLFTSLKNFHPEIRNRHWQQHSLPPPCFVSPLLFFGRYLWGILSCRRLTLILFLGALPTTYILKLPSIHRILVEIVTNFGCICSQILTYSISYLVLDYRAIL